MNVLITLPKNLIDAILSGKKKFELRSVRPKFMKLGEDGFFCVEKGTYNVRCWCRCENISEVYVRCISFPLWEKLLAESRQWIQNYVENKEKVYIWHIAEVVKFEEGRFGRNDLFVDRNPQKFTYCPFSFGRNF